MPLVYIVSDGELYKIGYTNNLKGRLSTLQSSSPKRLEVVRQTQVDWAFGFEAEVHALFYNYREYGEWFRLEPRHFDIYDYYSKIRITESGELIMDEKARERWNADPLSTGHIHKGMWIGEAGTSGRKMLSLRVGEGNHYVGGIPTHLWWELHYCEQYKEPAPMPCIQPPKKFQDLLNIVNDDF